MKVLKNWIVDYIWFIIESQKYMKDSDTRIKIFFRSLKKGKLFCYLMKQYRAELNK